MKTLPTVVIIGQTNAGKSSLMNRLLGRREAIVAREEGTTRDNVIATVDNSFILIDTAGLKDPENPTETLIRNQIQDAITSADLILVLIDGSIYPDEKTTSLVRLAQKSKKPYLIALNKSDLKNTLTSAEFRHFGEKTLHRLSATTGQGTTELKSAIMNLLPPPSPDSQNSSSKQPLKIALIGRPNVGKSSLFNALAKKQQALVSSKQGTTRDINRVQIKFKNQVLEIADTAGLRKPGKREVGIEKFSAIRTLTAIEESDICALLIDSTEPHSKLDQTLAGQIIAAGKGVILILTKTDLTTTDQNDLLGTLENDFNFLPYAPVILTSSQTGKNITKIYELSQEINQTRHETIKTSDLNKILAEATSEHTPAGLKNTRPKLRYITQTDIAPPWFVIYGSNLQQLHWSYKRFLERKIREVHPFIGTPIKFSFINSNQKSKKPV